MQNEEEVVPKGIVDFVTEHSPHFVFNFVCIHLLFWPIAVMDVSSNVLLWKCSGWRSALGTALCAFAESVPRGWCKLARVLPDSVVPG